MDGRVPDELVDRFAILRGDAPALDLPQGKIPTAAPELIRQSLRPIEGPSPERLIFGVVRLANPDCTFDRYGVCVLFLDSDLAECESAKSPPTVVTGWLDLEDGRQLVVVVVDDTLKRVRVGTDTAAAVEMEVDANVAFRIVPGPITEVSVGVVDP